MKIFKMPPLRGQTTQLGFTLAIAFVMFFLHLGSSRLWDEDEPRNARCAVEMMQRHDLIVPTFNDELRTHKPILLYWLTVGAYAVFGISEFAARCTSAMAGLGTVCCTWLLVSRITRPTTATLSAVALGSSLMFVVASRAATPDAILIFCMTLAITICVRETWVSAPNEDSDGLRFPGQFFPVRKRGLCSMYAAMGFALLAKGPIGFVLPMAILGMFLLVTGSDQDRRSVEAPGQEPRQLNAFTTLVSALAAWFRPQHFLRTLFAMRPLTGLLIALLIAAPWYAAVGLATNGEWLRGFFLEHNLGRAAASREGHGGPMLIYYPIALCVGFFPWSIFLTGCLMDFAAVRRTSWRRSVPLVLGLSWILVPMGLFSLAGTKLPSYITPGYPGMALVLGSFLDRLYRRETTVGRVWQQAAYGTGAVVAAAIGIGLPIAAFWFLPGEQWLGVIALPLLLGSVAAFYLARRGAESRAVPVYAAGAVAFTLLLMAVGVPRASQHRQFDRILDAARSQAPQARFASYGMLLSSWIFYADQPIKAFGPGGEEELAGFLKNSRSHFLLLESSQFEALTENLPISLLKVDDVPLFPGLPGQRLLLVQARVAPEIAQK